MALFWEFFFFELKFRLKSLSTYVYFALWFFLSFLAIAAEDFISTGNGKQLLNGPFSTTILYTFFTLFGTIIIAAIFGTSILRDFQRDTFQLIFTKPITKFAYLGGRWAGSFVTCIFAFSGMVFGEAAGTLAPWADHTRIASGHAWWYWQPFLFIVVIQIFFLGSLFFMVAALSRKIFVVYLQGVAVFMLYLIANAVFFATRSLEHFWSAIFDPIGLQLADVLARYWTVAEKNTLLFSWSPHVSQGVFLYNRLLWSAVGFISLVIVLSILSHVGGSADGWRTGPSRGQGQAAGSGRSGAAPFAGGSAAATRAPVLRRQGRIRPIRLPDAGAHSQYHARAALLGDHCSAGRLLAHQRLFRRKSERSECLPCHLPDGAGG